MVRKANSRPG